MFEDNVYAGEVIAQLFALGKAFPHDMEADSPEVSTFIKEVENAKDNEGQRAAIAGENPEGFDARATSELAEEGQVYVGKTLHSRRAVGDREGERTVNHPVATSARGITTIGGRVNCSCVQGEKLGTDPHGATNCCFPTSKGPGSH